MTGLHVQAGCVQVALLNVLGRGAFFVGVGALWFYFY